MDGRPDGSGHRHPLEVVVVVLVVLVGRRRLRDLRQAEQAGRMRPLVYFPQLGDRYVGIDSSCREFGVTEQRLDVRILMPFNNRVVRVS